MWETLEASSAPNWGVWLVLCLSLLIGAVSVRRAIPRFGVRILFVVLVTIAGILTAAAGPFLQSLFEAAVNWGTPIWIIRYFNALGLRRSLDELASLVRWGVLPGTLSALAAIVLQGWLRKVLGSGIVASLTYIVMDLIGQSKNLSAQIDIGYIININVVGGLLAGLVIGSSAFLGEKVCRSDHSFSHYYGKIRKPLYVSSLSSILFCYLAWYFFLDHPPVSVWFKMGKWDLVDISEPGATLGAPSYSHVLQDLRWVSFVIRPKERATMKSFDQSKKVSIQLASAGGLLPDRDDPSKFNDIFRGLKPARFQEDAGTAMSFEGNGGNLYLVGPDKGGLSLNVGLPSFDFVRFQHRESSEGCLALFFGRPFGETRARLSVHGELSMYVRSGSIRYGPWEQGRHEVPSFRVTLDRRGSRKPLYVAKGDSDLIWIRPEGERFEFSAMVGDFSLSSCDSLPGFAGALDFFRTEASEGVLRIGIDQYNISSGDHLLLASGRLSSRVKDGEWILQGKVKDVVVNDLRINKSRWGRASIEMKTTFVASLLGALGATIGWMMRRRSQRESHQSD